MGLHGGLHSKTGGICLKNQKGDKSPKNQQKKTKRKKKGKIAKVYRLHQEGVSVKEIAKRMKLKENVVRSYIWRKKNPEKYKALLKRYYDKKAKSQKKED